MKEYLTNNRLETESIGRKIGSILNKGDCILLTGDLGAGKTTLTKGIGKGLNIIKDINSPTFTIMKIYQGRVPLYHFDFYRLHNDSEDFDLADYIEGDGVAVIEWPDNARSLLPDEYLLAELTYLSDQSRKIRLSAKGQRYLKIMESIK
ncbi:MAG: tRNA (adenosine(37)-N6)-threonylcarbamoyltransferase complex ATPase subunit type 1 TsaE [Erysipelotrichales bacterium]|nr:tRNA (adenosine(37)-N6)-threonylcarbamoyltransferase complex ATPase subunit type 1 TsaE [Erysipelotrichales bacterium]